MSQHTAETNDIPA